jgi:hypothetical protein
MLKIVRTDRLIKPCPKCNCVDAVVVTQDWIPKSYPSEFAVACRNHDCRYVSLNSEEINAAVDEWNKRRVAHPAIWEQNSNKQISVLLKISQWLLGNCKINETVFYKTGNYGVCEHIITIKDQITEKERSYAISDEALSSMPDKIVIGDATRKLWNALADIRGMSDLLEEVTK